MYEGLFSMSSRAEASLRKAIFDLDKRIKKAVDAGVHSMQVSAGELAEIGEEELHKSIDHIGSYKPYIDTYGNLRMSSQPGEPPASKPGNPLDQNIYHNHVTAPKSNPAVAEFGVNGEVAHLLEWGTPKMAPRPFVRPAREKVRQRAKDIVINNFVGAMILSFAKSSATSVEVKVDI